MAKYTWCNGISLAYGLPAILSMLFSTVFMMVDFVIACVTNKKVNSAYTCVIRSCVCYCVLCIRMYIMYVLLYFAWADQRP